MDDRRAVFALHAAVAAAIAVTHSRVPADRLYNTRRGGLSRAAVFGCFPTAIAAVGTLPRSRGRLRLAALPLCATVALPGVVDEHHLDARPRNAPGLTGVALAALASSADAPPLHRGRSRLRPALAIGLAVISAPWLLAGVGRQTAGMAQPTPGEPGVDRVHLGHHEGLDGALLAWDALLLSRRRTGTAHSWYLALMLTYGVAVAAQDAWLEQVVKRGWTRRRMPDVIRPSPTPAWAALLAATPVVRRRLITGRPEPRRSRRRRTWRRCRPGCRPYRS